MGGEFDYKVTTVQHHNAADATIRAAFRAVVEQCQYDHGHAGYSGTLAEKHELTILREPVFATLIDACDYLMERPDSKWGPALAVWAKGVGAWVIGGWCSS